MTKQITVKVKDEFYDELSAYANIQGSNLTAFARFAVRNAFFNAMQADKQELQLSQRMLADPETFQLTNREKADLETKIDILTATTKRFEDTWADLASELYGEGGEYYA